MGPSTVWLNVVHVTPHISRDHRSFLSDMTSFTAKWMSQIKMEKHGTLLKKVRHAQDAEVAAFPAGRPAEAQSLIRRIIEEINQLHDDE